MEKQNKSFAWVGVKVWHSLPVEMRHESETSFNRKIHDLLVQIFSEADNYIDLPDLIKHWIFFEKSVYYICIIHPTIVKII